MELNKTKKSIKHVSVSIPNMWKYGVESAHGKPRKYSFYSIYKQGDLIRHEIFGLGIVIDTIHHYNKPTISILFKHGPLNLVGHLKLLKKSERPTIC